MSRVGRNRPGIASSFGAAASVGRTAAVDVWRHWVMASFSLVAAFGVWFVIQDVENPRVRGVVPIDATQRIAVQAVNVPDNYIFEGAGAQVRVEARDEELQNLVADDFVATVNLNGYDPEGDAEVRVEVRSRKSGVRVLEAIPATIRPGLVRAQSRDDVQVTVNEIGTPPEGYELRRAETSIEPAFVKITGTPDQLERVVVVEVDVNMAGRRDSGTVEGDLVARTASGNAVTVSIDPPRAKVSLKIAQTFSQRTLPVAAQITGHPAPGFRVAAVTYEPETVQVTGLQSVMSGLARIEVEPVDITGAATNVTQTRGLVRVPNTSVDRTSVTVRVEIRPYDCAPGQPSSQCPTAAVAVAVDLLNIPTGYAYEERVLQTTIHVSGSATAIAALKPEDFKATASLAAGLPGKATYIVVLTAQPPGIRVDAVEPISITLKAITVP